MNKPKFIKLRQRIIEFGYTQGETARAAEISAPTLSSRMTGAQPFTMWEIAQLCLVLDIPREEIHEYFMPLTLSATAECAKKKQSACGKD